MKKEIRRKLTLDRPVTYEIKVPGQLDRSWIERDGMIIVTVESEDDGPLITTLTCTVDQAALQSLLRRLYSLGMPLISVTYVDPDQADASESKP